MKVAIVHDDLVQWGGAERVLLGLSEIYPDAPIYTSVFDKTNPQITQHFEGKKIITSFMQQIPGWRFLYKALMPLYPLAFEQFCFDKYDLVISHTTRFAKSIITKPATCHICYCHTPPRFLWNFYGKSNFVPYLRRYDKICAQRPDLFLAGSKNAQKRIKKVYGRDSKVVYPFVDLERFREIESFDGGYFCSVGRPQKYKRFDLAKAACRKLGFPLKIIDGSLDDDMVLQVLAGCKALIVPGIEDFGLASLEAQALSKPVIAYAEGGSLETVIPGVSGIFFAHQTVASLTDAIIKLDRLNLDPRDCLENAGRFSKKKFIENFKEQVNDL